MFAEVILELPVEKRFDYSIPKRLSSNIKPGMRAWVPFGNRRLPGYIVALKENSGFSSPREIIKLIDKEPLLPPNLIRLAEWISEYYQCHIEKVFRSMLPGKIRQITPKRDETRYVRLIRPVEDILKLEKRAPRQAQVVRVLMNQSTAIRLMELAKLAGTSPGTISSLYKKGIVDILSQSIDRDPYRSERFQRSMPYILNEEQLSAYNLIKGMQAGVVLLQGVTGSGKTEIYLQAIDNVIKDGKGAIVIVPEISLTPQTVDRFKSRFSEGVAVLHSRLSVGERYDQWQKLYRGEARIAIGARSAIFAPVRNLGLIVVDEEHERTYKQEEEPRYHARDVAVKRGQIEKALVLLGSATPSLESHYMAQQGVYKLAKLTRRIDNRPLADIKIINMKDEIKKFRRLLTFSPLLLNHIRASLANKQQVILFLNRRGFSPFIICRKCGFVMRCPNCTTALTYHQLGDKLICHTCGHTEAVPGQCPECGDPHIRFSGIGTQRVESQIAMFFPSAHITRMDTDVTSLKGIHKRILDKFKKGGIDILVGTQMIAKGLDFPNVTVIGVISADIALHLPDFRAGEHTFQLLTQVSGRAGRGEAHGNVIIQTLTPEHPAIKVSSTQDYDLFAKEEMAVRRDLDYPPYEHFVNITFKSRNPQKAELVSRHYQKLLDGLIHPAHTVILKIYGPIPAPISRLRGFYRWQVLCKAPAVAQMNPYIKQALLKIGRPEGVHIAVDVDPINML